MGTAVTQSGMLGVGPGVGNGMWTLVERWEATVAAASKTFSGLNGDADTRYLVKSVIVNNGSSGNPDYLIQLNDESDANYYKNEQVYAYNGVAGANNAAAAGLQHNSANVNGGVAVATTEIYAKSPGYRYAMGDSCRSSGTANETRGMSSGIWLRTANITSIKVVGVANDMGAGSYIELWKLGPPPPIAQGMWALVERKTIAQATQSVTFTNLDGDSARRFFVVTRFVSGASGQLNMTYNSDTTNYYQQYFNVSNGTVGGGSGSTIGVGVAYTDGPGKYCFSETVIDAAQGARRKAIVHRSYDSSSLTPSTAQIIATDWTVTNANITQLVFNHDGSGGIGVGSYIELWKLSQ